MRYVDHEVEQSLVMFSALWNRRGGVANERSPDIQRIYRKTPFHALSR